jgi:hypothetical protein
MSLDVLPFGIAHHMALLPLVWLGWLRVRGKRLDVAWWWLAGAFAVSWLADTAAHFTDAWVIGAVYPVSQAALVCFVFLSRDDAMKVVLVLMVVGIADIIWHGVDSPDILLRTVAWLSVVGIVWPLRQLGRLRASLLVAFGIGWWCWMIYAISPGWWTWGVYQLARLAGILLFCWAATSPLPRLKLSRR